MNLDFVNRSHECHELDVAARHGGLLVVYGRRRVGKSRLLRHWLDAHKGLYSQAIEAHRNAQIEQVFHDIQPQLDSQLTPKSWQELLELLRLQKKPWVLCLDEVPYLTAVDPSLPSQLQKWLDHDLPRGCLLILAGSSNRMMHDLFLHRSAPLYGRARKLLHVQPMSYAAFTDACHQKPSDMDSFAKFSCIGGIPKYWEFVERHQDLLTLVESLYFDFAPYMEQEPHRILHDEGTASLNALAVLEAIGRGAERPSEIAARMGTMHTNLSRPLQQLIDTSILYRELPFGESARSTKRVLYRIQDPAIRFWFRVFSPHRSLWPSYTTEQKRKFIHDHTATVFEDLCRARHPGSARYWDKDTEIDLVAPDPLDGKNLLVAEVKWRHLSARDRLAILHTLEAKWARCPLRRNHPKPRFEVLDAGVLASHSN